MEKKTVSSIWEITYSMIGEDTDHGKKNIMGNEPEKSKTGIGQ
jgi:hypothetical protein